MASGSGSGGSDGTEGGVIDSGVGLVQSTGASIAGFFQSAIGFFNTGMWVPATPATAATIGSDTSSVASSVASSIESVLPSSTNIKVWLVLIIVLLLLVAYIMREVEG